MTAEMELKVHDISNHASILDYPVYLSDDEISDLVQDYDYCYDSYFGSKENENNETNN